MADVNVTIGYYFAIEAPIPPLQMQIAVLDDTLDQAPTSLTVIALGGLPESDVSFLIDGDEVYTSTLDTQGGIGPISIPVDAAHGAAGSHTVSISGDGLAGSATFALDRAPNADVVNMGPDTAPVAIPGAVVDGVRRWVLQDLMPDGLGSWIFPANPTSADPWPFHKGLSATPNVLGNKVHVTGRGPIPHAWSFSGVGMDEDTYDHLKAYAQINRRFYLIDHRNRAWNFTITSFAPTPRLRVRDEDGVDNDWMFDYTVSGIIFGNEWQEPES